MKLTKPYSNKQYADLAVYCNQNGLIIEDKGKYLEAVNPPEKTVEEKEAEARAERDRRIDAIRWRIERYQTQGAAGLETTDTAEHYKAILLYVQALRDVPEQAGFPNIIEWPVIEEKTENTKDTEELDITPESESTEEIE